MNISSQKFRVLSLYRQLLNSTKRAFKNDTFMLQKSRDQIRMEFATRRDLRDEREIEQCIQNAIEANFVIQNEIVQGEANVAHSQNGVETASNEYKIKLQDEHVSQNLDQTVFVKEIDEEMLGRMERKAAREERRRNREQERREQQQERETV